MEVDYKYPCVDNCLPSPVSVVLCLVFHNGVYETAERHMHTYSQRNSKHTSKHMFE